MENEYMNVKVKNCVHSTNQAGPRRFHGAVVLCLGLLSVFLLAGLIALSVHYYNSGCDAAAELAAVKTSMTELLQASNNKLSSMTEDRDQLKANLTEMTQERKRSQSLYKQTECKTCPSGWTVFNCSCYFLSKESGSWTKGTEDCTRRGADLVIIDSVEEKTFISGFTKVQTWIGLNDTNTEGTWKWIDGTQLTWNNWGKNQPDNGGNEQRAVEEDCAHIRVNSAEWNDLPCQRSLQWICEK